MTDVFWMTEKGLELALGYIIAGLEKIDTEDNSVDHNRRGALDAAASWALEVLLEAGDLEEALSAGFDFLEATPEVRVKMLIQSKLELGAAIVDLRRRGAIMPSG